MVQPKKVKSYIGQFEIEIPRDCSSVFEPHLVKKNQTKLMHVIDEKILSIFALGTSYRDIRDHI